VTLSLECTEKNSILIGHLQHKHQVLPNRAKTIESISPSVAAAAAPISSVDDHGIAESVYRKSDEDINSLLPPVVLSSVFSSGDCSPAEAKDTLRRSTSVSEQEEESDSSDECPLELAPSRELIKAIGLTLRPATFTHNDGLEDLLLVKGSRHKISVETVVPEWIMVAMAAGKY
jgi:hypothetical protein